MAGHSEWANKKFRKERQDRKKSGVFSKLIKEVTLQARNGDPNPENNSGLAQALERAKAANVPKDSIDRAIKRGAGELEGAAYEEITYEGYASDGVAVLVRAVTDNRNRAAADIRHVFSKHGGNMVPAGSVAWLFERRGIVVLEDLPEDVDHDELEMALIEAGADDLQAGGGTLEAFCAVSALPALSAAVQAMGVTPTRAEVTMVPKNTVHIGETSAGKVLRLIDALDDNEDVQEVFANFDVDDDVLERLESGE
ncbi:MAG: YebC/PmpR family DNA-binding transcriptional regulator [Candidatus Bipolaricaulis sp.]|nr:YebC/PmpR family DNA-binding transcriptional regulator [Candidatus Bipolaricaulis sp.]